MAGDFEAISYVDVVSDATVTRTTVRWSRAVPAMLLIPIIFAFGTPVFAFALLAAVLAAPLVVVGIAVFAAQHERSA